MFNLCKSGLQILIYIGIIEAMIKRKISSELLKLKDEYPVVSILGPRQAGKTTLAKMELPDYAYVNLEIPENRELASTDPKAFFKQYSNKVIIDEIYRVPTLLSYIQGIVDERHGNGQFIITGSHQLELKAAITQSLAGRVGILHLLPLSIEELTSANFHPKSFTELIFNGFLPRVHSESQRPSTAYSNYYQTYVERDVRQLINLKSVSLFEKFLKLLAGRVGQVINYTSLSNDVGVDTKAIKNWLSILEASFIIFKLSPYYNNFGKRLIKAPKYYFIDTGLLCFLLGIQNSQQVERDPLVGNLYENLVVIDCLKALYNRGQINHLYFYRDSNGQEVDLLFEKGREIIPIEIKSSSTFTNAMLAGIKSFKSLSKKINQSYVVYNGDPKELSNQISLINTRELEKIFNS